MARPPRVGTLLLILSNLGIGGPPLLDGSSSHREWFDLAQAARRRGSSVVALVPYPPSRWPRALARVVAMLEWDRTTTASAAKRAARLLLRRAQHG